jgi:hypothetical protein
MCFVISFSGLCASASIPDRTEHTRNLIYFYCQPHLWNVSWTVGYVHFLMILLAQLHGLCNVKWEGE